MSGNENSNIKERIKRNLKWFDWIHIFLLIMMIISVFIERIISIGNWGFLIGILPFTIWSLLSIIIGKFKYNREIRSEKILFLLIFIGYSILSFVFVLKRPIVQITSILGVTGGFYFIAFYIWAGQLKKSYKNRNISLLILSYIILSILIIFLFVGFYAGMGSLGKNGRKISKDNLETVDYIYFSVITFTSTGYGDYYPIGNARIVAIIESYIGMAFNVVVIGIVISRFANTNQ